MKTLGKALGSAAFALVYLFLLAAGAVVAEPPPPENHLFPRGGRGGLSHHDQGRTHRLYEVPACHGHP